jgi:hypothetical protein
MTTWTDVEVALLNNGKTKVIGKANVSFSTSNPDEYPKYMVIEGHEFERTEDGIAVPVIRYRHMKACNCQKGGN